MNAGLQASRKPAMLMRLLPQQIDNEYRGNVAAIWILVPLALIKVLQGANVAGLLGASHTRRVLEGIDKVPVSALPAEAASTWRLVMIP